VETEALANFYFPPSDAIEQLMSSVVVVLTCDVPLLMAQNVPSEYEKFMKSHGC